MLERFRVTTPNTDLKHHLSCRRMVAPKLTAGKGRTSCTVFCLRTDGIDATKVTNVSNFATMAQEPLTIHKSMRIGTLSSTKVTLLADLGI